MLNQTTTGEQNLNLVSSSNYNSINDKDFEETEDDGPKLPVMASMKVNTIKNMERVKPSLHMPK